MDIASLLGVILGIGMVLFGIILLEVSESRVSQLHTKGLIKMRKVMGPYMNILTNV